MGFAARPRGFLAKSTREPQAHELSRESTQVGSPINGEITQGVVETYLGGFAPVQNLFLELCENGGKQLVSP